MHQAGLPGVSADVGHLKRANGEGAARGAGSYGQVFKALRGGVQPVAVKVFPSNATDLQMAEFQKEVVILKSCSDRNIVQFLGACVTDTQTCLITECARPPPRPTHTPSSPHTCTSILWMTYQHRTSSEWAASQMYFDPMDDLSTKDQQ